MVWCSGQEEEEEEHDVPAAMEGRGVSIVKGEPRTVLSRLTLATRSSTLVFITPRSALRVRGQRCPRLLLPPLASSSSCPPPLRPLLPAAAPRIIMRSVFRPLFTFTANKNTVDFQCAAPPPAAVVPRLAEVDGLSVPSHSLFLKWRW